MSNKNKMVIKTSELMTLRDMGLNAREIVEYFMDKNYIPNEITNEGIKNFQYIEKQMAIAIIKAFRLAKKEGKHIIYYF